MVSSNPTNLEIKDLDNTFSIDVVKPFPTNSKYMSSASSSSYPGVVLMENTSPSGTSIKLLKDTINSPRTNSDKFNNKPQGSNPQSLNPDENSNLRTISSNMLENNNSPNNAVKDDKERGKDATMQNIKPDVQKEELCISIQMNSENKPELINDEHEAYPASGKRKLEADDDVNENLKKKVHIETAGPSLFEDEEQDITSFIRILDDNEANIQYEEPEGQSNSIMIKIHSDVVDPQPEKQSASSPSKKLSLLNSQIKQSQSPDKIKSRVSKQPKEKQKPDLISPYKKEKQTTVQESDGGFDLFGFEDGLGIKILDEVFLCQYCQSQIPQDAGLKDICLKCQNKESKGFTLSEHRTILSETCMESESDFYSNSQPFPIKIINNDRPHIKSFEFGTSLRPEQNIETQVGRETSDDEWVDILNHACFKDKLLCVGHKYQAEVTSLGLYDNKPRRDIRRLWNPSRVDLATFEKFRTDVNTRNATYLIDEEVAEILVRNECDVQKALEFSIKANLEFQTYLKRSSNRRRLITKMSVR